MTLTKSQQKKLVSIVLTIIIILLGGYTLQQPQQETITKGPVDPGYYRVVKISDGDTISVDTNGVEEDIRMIGVDTPETHHPSKPVQCFGKAATQFTTDFIGTKPVRLEADPLNDNRDRYSRLLRYVYTPDGKMLNRELIAEGYGFAYTSFPMEKTEEFQKLEDTAREKSLGLWGGCEIKTTKYGTSESAPE
jgi:endonuclease YncB( thermonuclease family)